MSLKEYLRHHYWIYYLVGKNQTDHLGHDNYFWDGIIEEGDVLNCDEYESFKNNYKEAQND